MSKEKTKKRWLFFGRDKYTYDIIEELVKKGVGLKIGEVVTLNGYYTAGDGAGHKRIIANEDDGSGVQLNNKLWANIVHNGEVNISWFGAKGDGVTDDTEMFQKALNYSKNVIIPTKTYYLEEILVPRQTSLIGLDKRKSVLNCKKISISSECNVKNFTQDTSRSTDAMLISTKNCDRAFVQIHINLSLIHI